MAGARNISRLIGIYLGYSINTRTHFASVMTRADLLAMPPDQESLT